MVSVYEEAAKLASATGRRTFWRGLRFAFGALPVARRPTHSLPALVLGPMGAPWSGGRLRARLL
eukprot:4953299-Pyramimonas_sp.AAC.1